MAIPDGVWWVPLAPLRDPRLVLETAAQVVGSKNGLAEHIADKAMLLLFDNFEQVVEAAPGVAALLAECPQLELLVTSREPLHVPASRSTRCRRSLHEEGVGFFAARARAVKPDFEATRRLPRSVAASTTSRSRSSSLHRGSRRFRPSRSSRGSNERLPLLTGGSRDAPERQRTLRATIEWSHDLLSARGAAAVRWPICLRRRLHAGGS